MKLSAPVHQLKRKAKILSREEDIPHHEALNRIALGEGYADWSLLAAKLAAVKPAARLFARLKPGELLLVGARPGQGKTLFSLELAVEAMKSGSPAIFFTLEYTEGDVLERFRAIGVDRAEFGGLFEFDGSDSISATHIIGRLGAAPRGTLVVIDYLQLLDQRRENPELMEQVRALKSFAERKGLVIVCISQIDRSYDSSRKAFPDIGDVRLPNALDLRLFNQTCFLKGGKAQFVDGG